MHLETRVAVLEAIENRRRAEAVDASREADRMSSMPKEWEKPAAEDPQVSELIIKMQQMEGAIGHLRKKLEKQAVQLEAMVRHQEMQVCKALDERCNVIEERLHDSLMAQSHRVLDKVHKDQLAHIAGQSDVSSMSESTTFPWWSKAPSTRTGYDNDTEACIAEEAIERETTKTTLGSAVVSYTSSEPPTNPTPTHTASMSLYANEDDNPQDHRRRQVIHGRLVSPGIYERDPGSVAVWHPFSGPEPGGAGLHLSREDSRQSRHLSGHHLGPRPEERTKSRGHPSSSSGFDNATAPQPTWWRHQDM